MFCTRHTADRRAPLTAQYTAHVRAPSSSPSVTLDRNQGRLLPKRSHCALGSSSISSCVSVCRSPWLYWPRIFWNLHIGWWSSFRHQHHQSRRRLFYFIPTKSLLRRRDGAKLQAHDSFTIYDADHNLPRSPALRVTHELFTTSLSRF